MSASLKRQEKPNIGSGLFLQGAKGTGKTHLACGYLKEYALQGQSIRFVTVPDLFLSIRASFGGDTSEEGVVDSWRKTQVLVLDDLGTEKLTDWAYQTLYAILDYRYREMLITIITSNYTKKKLEGKIGERLVSRFYEMCTTITLKGRDRRIDK
ncbi:MAG: ATP-binding protein [Candidatus Pacebacteria bacterium]|nr:ATP-binding protein [Candidatus Paceibacterota bacterium]